MLADVRGQLLGLARRFLRAFSQNLLPSLAPAAAGGLGREQLLSWQAVSLGEAVPRVQGLLWGGEGMCAGHMLHVGPECVSDVQMALVT